MSNSKRRAYVKARMKELIQEREAQIKDIQFLRNRYAKDPFMADYSPKPSLSPVPVYDRVETYFVFSESRRSA